MISIEKINSIKINGINFKDDPDVFTDLENDVSKYNLLAIGESHGVKENADIYYSLFHRFRFDTIAFEYPTTYEADLYRFVKHGELSDILTKKRPGDGRLNLEYLALLKKLWDEKVLKNITCFDSDEPTKTWNDRDQLYAKEFMKKYKPESKTLLIAGNLHTRKNQFHLEYDLEELIPMGQLLEEKLGPFPDCKIIYHSGSLFNFEIKKLENTQIQENYLEKIAETSYMLHVKNATPITLW